MATPKEEDYGVHDPLPALENLPGGDQRFYNDMYNDSGVPQEVAADAAGMSSMSEAPAIPETGMRFDFGSLNVQTKEDFAALPDEQKELLRAMKRGVQFTEESAAKFVLGQRERQQKLQDSMQDPVKQAQLAERNAKVVERQAVQNDFKIRRQNTIKNIEEILGDKDYSSLVGPIDGTIGRVYDAAFNEKMQAKRAKLDRLINIDVLDMTKYLRPISQDELKYLRTLVPGQTQNWEVYKQYLGEKLEMLKATDKAAFNPATSLPLAADDAPASTQPAAAAPSAAQGRNTFTTPDGYTYRRMPDGSAELVE